MTPNWADPGDSIGWLRPWFAGLSELMILNCYGFSLVGLYHYLLFLLIKYIFRRIPQKKTFLSERWMHSIYISAYFTLSGHYSILVNSIQHVCTDLRAVRHYNNNSKEICIYWLSLIILYFSFFLNILPRFQIIGRWFFDLKFDHSSYSKIYAKYHFFCCGLLYQYKFFKDNLNLIMFVQMF